MLVANLLDGKTFFAHGLLPRLHTSSHVSRHSVDFSASRMIPSFVVEVMREQAHILDEVGVLMSQI